MSDKPVQFKCNHSGNIYEFVHPHDIQAMRKHTEYTEVVETPEVQEEQPKTTTRTSKQK